MNWKIVAGACGIGAFAVGSVILFNPRGTDSCSTCSAGMRAAPPIAAASTLSATSAHFVVDDNGRSTFLIDAPLEKIKGESTKFRGKLDVDVRDITKSTGEIDLDLGDLKTETFDDKDKNTAQTEHAHNWLELGDDVAAKEREENRWARFTIRSIETATPAPDTKGLRTVKIVAKGDMWLHGVTSPKLVKLSAMFSGPVDAPTSLHIVSDEPITISLKEHDVKPRDVAGKFLNGALERVGKKIDDSVHISIDVAAKRANRS